MSIPDREVQEMMSQADDGEVILKKLTAVNFVYKNIDIFSLLLYNKTNNFHQKEVFL